MNASSLQSPSNGSFGPDPPPSGGHGSGPPPAPILTGLQINIALFGYAFLYILGFIGHISSILIFLRPALRRVSTSCLFIALTICDSIYLLVSIYNFINVGLQQRDQSIDPSAMCRLRDFIQWTSMCCNAWFLVMISVDRWIRVRFPFKSKEVCTPRNALLIIINIVILSAIFNVHTLIPKLYGQRPAGIMTVCGSTQTDPVYANFSNQILPALFSSVQTLLPVILILIFSCDTFRRLTRQSSTIHDNTHSRRRTQLDNQMLLIMLASITLFMITNLPVGLFNIIRLPILVGLLTQTQQLELSSVFTFVVSINYGIDFYMHCLTSRLFRKEFVQVFTCGNGNRRVGQAIETMKMRTTVATLTQVQIGKRNN